jgi:hypothetical protein
LLDDARATVASARQQLAAFDAEHAWARANAPELLSNPDVQARLRRAKRVEAAVEAREAAAALLEEAISVAGDVVASIMADGGIGGGGGGGRRRDSGVGGAGRGSR